MNYAQETGSKSKPRKSSAASTTDAGEALRDRVEHVRDMVENVRDRAETAFREKPYLVPVAAGAAGFGVGLLFGSKMMRFFVMTAVGTVLTEAVGGEVRRLAGDFLTEFQHRLGEGEGAEEIEPRESSAV